VIIMAAAAGNAQPVVPAMTGCLTRDRSSPTIARWGSGTFGAHTARERHRRAAMGLRRLLPDRLKRGYHAVLRASSSLVDRALRVDTARKVNLADYGLDHPERVSYEAGSWLDLLRVLRIGAIRRDDVFLDLGCGKGRALLMASLYPFRRVSGVELAPELARVARRNIETFRPRKRCASIEVEVADAVAYPIPDDVSVVYLFNPFRGQTFATVVANLIASIDRNPRTVRVVYRNAMYEDALLSTGRARLVRMSPGLRPSREWREAAAVRLYAVEPAVRQRTEFPSAPADRSPSP
jgi:SAM-dependent methyltransferase